MFIGTNGIVVDNRGRVLLILRDDTRTWAIPGGALDAGELPTDGVIREVKEETGFQVQPSRLVGLYHWSDKQDEFLILVFRCIIDGGEMTKSEESLQVKFSRSDSLPRSLLGLHRERLERGLIHDGSAPYWGEQSPSLAMALWKRFVGPVVYRLKDIRRRRRRESSYQPPLPWSVASFVVIQNEAEDVLWVMRTDYDLWNLPGGGSKSGEAPWSTAVRETREETGLDVELLGCSGIYVKPKQNLMVFTFTARVAGGELITGSEAAEFAYFSPGAEPENTLPRHVERVADAVSFQDIPYYRIQDQPPGLELLGAKPKTMEEDNSSEAGNPCNGFDGGE
jgi:8-oxo-dGTP diphosphatase